MARAKAQRRKEREQDQQSRSFSGLLSLRLCAFARVVCFRSLALLVIALSAGVVSAQKDVHSHVTISVARRGEIKVEAELEPAIDSWSFRNAYAGVLGVAERIEEFRAADAGVRKAATGEYRSDREVNKISYVVKLSKPTLADVSHVSWLTDERGILFLADLVPIEIQNHSASFVLPADWTVESSSPRNAEGKYEVSEPEKAVFLIGRKLRRSTNNADGISLDVITTGKWSFKEKEVLDAATAVTKRYLALTGFRLPGRSTITIAPLPIDDEKTGWKAETRGSTVVLLVNPRVKVKRWKAQMTIIFAHELLHLWVPNSLKLEGDYDWFFEGFTLYTALRTSLDLGAIDFKEYLKTLGRVYDAYSAQPDTLSLIAESERRWASAGSQVYIKGMLVAFMYDLLVREESGGQRTLADSYRALFSGARADGMDGNEVIISLLSSTPVSRSFLRSYVENNTRVELGQFLPKYGLSVDFTGAGSQLRVHDDLSTEQKRLLRSLGYRD